MSHKPNVFSPPGTPVLDRTVGELVAERPGRSRIFQTFGIDFCCQGGRTLREACERKRIPFEMVVEPLEAEALEGIEPAENPAQLPPAELAVYIMEKHHRFLWSELPRLHAMAERVAHVHGGHTPSLRSVFDVVVRLEQELVSHMTKEEQVLFPAVIALSSGEAAGPSAGALEGPLACMQHEHEEVGADLGQLRELSHGFRPPTDACNTYRALFAGLQDLEEDLHRHIHLENAVLFPAVKELASGRA